MSLAKKRLRKVFNFLKQLNQLRNPTPTDVSGDSKDTLWLDTWPSHPCIVVQRGNREEEIDDKPNAEIDPIISIRRAKVTKCPPPPAILIEWITSDWPRLEADIKTLPSKNEENEQGQTLTIAFGDDQGRVDALARWREKRDAWVTAERPNAEARQLFEEVRSLWTLLQREGDRVELMLGDGMLRVTEPSIQHPVLLQRVSLEFDPNGPELQFFTGTEKAELNRQLLRLVPKTSLFMLNRLNAEADEECIEPLGGESTDGFLKRVIQGLLSDGEFIKKEEQDQYPQQTVIWREAVIFCRDKSVGLNTSLEYALEAIDDEEKILPVGLQRIVGIDPDASQESETTDGEDRTPPPESSDVDILYSKPANKEQYEIADRLEAGNSVLVQGPPGTGKTHTTANLLGHLLAQGKTVLVTAHTTKALRVLRDEIDSALQPLCLSVLGSDTKNQAQLARAAHDISNRLSDCDATSFRNTAATLSNQRRKKKEAAASLKREILAARHSEFEAIAIGGQSYGPSEAATHVRQHEKDDGWLPAPLNAELCPITTQEVQALYATQAKINLDDQEHLAVSQPAGDELVPESRFRLRVREQLDAQAVAADHQPQYWQDTAPAATTAQSLNTLHECVSEAAKVLAEEQAWLREVLYAGWMGAIHLVVWLNFLEEVAKLAKNAIEDTHLITTYGPTFLEDAVEKDERIATLQKIVDYQENDGALGWKTKILHADWHRLIEKSRVDGRRPTELDHFRALHAAARLPVKRNDFKEFWNRAVTARGGPPADELGPFPERTAENFASQIRLKLAWREEHWNPLIGQLQEHGFRWDNWLDAHPAQPGPHGEFGRVRAAVSDQFTSVIRAKAALVLQDEMQTAFQDQRTYLARFPQSAIASELLATQLAWDADGYTTACRDLARIEGLRSTYEHRLTLLDTLRPLAPMWVGRLERRDPPHDQAEPPGNAAQAWLWRQLHEELEKRAAVSMSKLGTKLEEVEKDIAKLAAQIIDLETWAAQKDRTTLQQQQALAGFVQTLKKIGRGKGKRAPKLMREARKLLVSARSAVPVWIMPLARVYETFDARDRQFDVVIVDEASQADVTALAALYLGKQHVVVGDKEQVTPDAIGQQIEGVEKLIETELDGIPNSHLYDGQTSIYDLAEAAFPKTISLWEHFRSVPEIIQFSNALSYDNKILPLRNPSSATVTPALVEHRVADGWRYGNENQREAEEVASLVAACIAHPAYRENHKGQPTSVGVVSMLAEQQASAIQRLLEQHLSADVLHRHRVLCGNASHFQGDERDVMFLSLVDGPPESGIHPKKVGGPRDMYKKRYNVAASRPRNQLWVVHSLDAERHLQTDDLRRRLISHARDPQALMRLLEDKVKKTESVFEARVLKRLVKRGYNVIPQWRVGAAFRIDLVVEGEGESRLAVECDGEQHHPPEKIREDMERQAILQRLGWVFERIRGSVFFRDADRAMQPVFEKLERMEIRPVETMPEATPPSETLQEVRRDAEAIRRRWREHKFGDDENDESLDEPEIVYGAPDPTAGARPEGGPPADEPGTTQAPRASMGDNG